MTAGLSSNWRKPGDLTLAVIHWAWLGRGSHRCDRDVIGGTSLKHPRVVVGSCRSKSVTLVLREKFESEDLEGFWWGEGVRA